jgi:hypothetical protein
MGVILDAMDLLRNENVAQDFCGQIYISRYEKRKEAAEEGVSAGDCGASAAAGASACEQGAGHSGGADRQWHAGGGADARLGLPASGFVRDIGSSWASR